MCILQKVIFLIRIEEEQKMARERHAFHIVAKGIPAVIADALSPMQFI